MSNFVLEFKFLGIKKAWYVLELIKLNSLMIFVDMFEGYQGIIKRKYYLVLFISLIFIHCMFHFITFDFKSYEFI